MTYWVYIIECRIRMQAPTIKDYKGFMFTKKSQSTISKALDQPRGLTRKQFAKQAKGKYMAATGFGEKKKPQTSRVLKMPPKPMKRRGGQ